ncbi:MAG: hypothetical protein ACRDJH_26340 [Thermomicrobiales bacterium]
MKTSLPRHIALPLVIAIALLGAISPLAVAGDRHAQSDTDGTPAVSLSAVYSSDDGAFMGRYIALDPDTLADREGVEPLKLGAPTWQSVVSADGSTMVAIKGGQVPGIVVWDARTGEKRGHFEPPGPVFEPVLSRDGSRLVASDFTCCDMTRHPVWYVLDTADGRLITEVEAREPDRWANLPGDIPPELIDPEARNLYRLVVPSSEDDDGPRPVTLVAYDLTTGEERGRLALPEVLGGSWPTERIVRGEPVEDHLTPGFALSPDGRSVAIVHADTQKVTLVDAGALTVTKTIIPEPEVSRLDRFLGFLSLAPRTAVAKVGSEGPTVRAVFAPDGRELYVYGTKHVVTDDGLSGQRGLGLTRINLDTGTIEVEALSGKRLSDVIPAPDGETLYVLNGSLLYRLTAETLSVEAERFFATLTRVFVAPA